MDSRVRLGAFALTAAWIAGFSFAPSSPASAQGLFSGGSQARYLITPTSRRAERRMRRPGYNASPFWVRSVPGPTPPAQRVQAYVSSPKYYTYKADALEVVSLAPLAETKVAATGPIESVADDEAFAEDRLALEEWSMRLLPEVGTAILEHYRRYPEYMWLDDGRVNARAYAAMSELQRADRFGLDPADYTLEVPRGDLAQGEAGSSALTPIQFEMALTAKILTYVLDANRGRIDPNRLSGYHDFERKKIDLSDTLMELAAEADPARFLAAQSPTNAAFSALASALEALRGTETPERVEIADGTFVRPGESHGEIANIVAAVKLAGSPALIETHKETLAAYAGESAYSEGLVALVKSFQREKGLTVDGVIGPNTIRAMVPESNEEKIRKIELAMERLRWLPRELGAKHVFINQPAFLASYLEDGKDPLTMRVVVGKKANQTYFFMDRIETVEYNPYWGVPRSIIVNEMLPKLYQDPSYLDRLGYEVSTASGARVSSTSVNWGGVANKTVPINVRQPPGSGNALGRVKILFPNSHAIYMHDTPHKSLFERDSRAFSHGCVRLHQPREMAAAVLGKSVDYIDQRIAQGRNDSDEVTDDIPVYVSYFTAWPEADGTVRFYDDVYDRDDYLARAIDTTRTERHAES